MKTILLPVTLLVLTFSYLILCSPTHNKSHQNETSAEKNNSMAEEKEQSSEKVEVMPHCELFIEEEGKIMPTNKTKEQLNEERIQYHEICNGDGDRIGEGTIASLCCG